TSAWNQLLNQDDFGVDQHTCFVVGREQGIPIISAPRLCTGKAINGALESGLENNREIALEALNFLASQRPVRLGLVNSESGGQFIRTALVVAPLQDAPSRRRHKKSFAKPRVVLCKEGRRFLVTGDQHPSF